MGVHAVLIQIVLEDTATATCALVHLQLAQRLLILHGQHVHSASKQIQ